MLKLKTSAVYRNREAWEVVVGWSPRALCIFAHGVCVLQQQSKDVFSLIALCELEVQQC